MWNSLTGCVLSCFCLQVLRFNVEARTWTQIGKLEHKRANHAIAEANLNALCPPVGNINPVIKDINIINIIITKELCVQIYVNL